MKKLFRLPGRFAPVCAPLTRMVFCTAILKPANIMIDGRGRVRLMDFGLSGLALELAGARDFAGTPMYMAPSSWRVPAPRFAPTFFRWAW